MWVSHTVTTLGRNGGYLDTTYEGIPNLTEFIDEFEDKVSDPHRLLVLEEALKATPARWWDTHKKSIDD